MQRGVVDEDERGEVLWERNKENFGGVHEEYVYIIVVGDFRG